MKHHHFWTPEEDQDILDNYATTPNKVFAERFGVKPNAVSHRYIRLTRGYPGTRRNYSHTQREFLIANWSTMSVSDLAKELGVSKASLCTKVFFLRKAGYVLPVKNDDKGRGRCPIGYTRITKHTRLIKTEEGWKYFPKPKIEKPTPVKKEKKAPKPKIVKVKVVKERTKQVKIQAKQAKVIEPKRKVEKVFKSKTVDYSQGTWVRVNSKTLVFKRTA